MWHEDKMGHKYFANEYRPPRADDICWSYKDGGVGGIGITRQCWSQFAGQWLQRAPTPHNSPPIHSSSLSFLYSHLPQNPPIVMETVRGLWSLITHFGSDYNIFWWHSISTNAVNVITSTSLTVDLRVHQKIEIIDICVCLLQKVSRPFTYFQRRIRYLINSCLV